jgi:hypothetical protein
MSNNTLRHIRGRDETGTLLDSLPGVLHGWWAVHYPGRRNPTLQGR